MAAETSHLFLDVFCSVRPKNKDQSTICTLPVITQSNERSVFAQTVKTFFLTRIKCLNVKNKWYLGKITT